MRAGKLLKISGEAQDNDCEKGTFFGPSDPRSQGVNSDPELALPLHPPQPRLAQYFLGYGIQETLRTKPRAGSDCIRPERYGRERLLVSARAVLRHVGRGDAIRPALGPRTGRGSQKHECPGAFL